MELLLCVCQAGCVCLGQRERTVVWVSMCMCMGVYVKMYVYLLLGKQINVSSDTHFPVKYKEAQSADTNKEGKAK